MRPSTSGPGERLVALALVALVLASSVSGVVTVTTGVASAAANSGTVEGTPYLNASAPDARLEPGQDGTVSVSLTNNAKIDDNNETHPSEARTRAGEARSIDVNVSDTRDAPLTVRTNAQPAGTIQDGQTGGPYTFDVLVDEDAQPGTYKMNVTTEYRHAERVTYDEVAEGEYQYSEEVVNRTETDTITVEIEPEPDIEVDYEYHDVPVGGEGIIYVNATNTGGESVTDATLSLTSSDSDLYFGSGTASSETNLGDLGAGETKVRRFRAGTVESAVKRPYSIDSTVQYTDSEDNQGSQSDSFAIVPEPRTRFTVENLTHDVPQNGEGMLTVNVSHSAGKDIEDVTVTATATDGDVYLGSPGSPSSTVQFDQWGADQSRQLTFRAGTGDSTVNRSYPIELQFEYTDSDDNDNSRTEYVEFVPGGRERFAVENLAHDVSLGGEGTLTMNVSQVAGKDIEDVTVTATATDGDVYLGSPGSPSSTVQFDQWEANRSRQLTLRAGTGDSAVNRSYPIELQFEYTDSDDNDNSRTKYVEFVPHERSEFRVTDLDHNVPQAGEGTITMNVSQVVGKDIEDVTVTATAPDTAVYLGSDASRSATTRFERWSTNATRRLTFRAGTDSSAVNRSYPIELQFEYTDRDDNDNSRTEYVQFVPHDRPEFEIRTVDHDVPREGTGYLTVEATSAVSRNISDVTVTATAPDSEVYLGSEASPSATAFVETWTAGERKRFTFRPGTTANAVANRTYPIELQFEYTDRDDNDNSRTEYVQFVPRERQQFTVVSIDHDVPVGDTGRIELTLRNEGPLNATDATLTASSTVDALFFGTGGAQEPIEAPGGISFDPPETGTPTSAAYVGDWPAGETRTVTLRGGFDENAIEQAYTADLSVNYDNEDGDAMPTRTTTVGVAPAPEQAFDFERVESDLSVGEEGDLIGEVTNRANRTVQGVVVTVEDDRQTINFYNTRYSVGRLEPGETATFRYRVGVTEEAEHGPKLFELAARYRGSEDTVKRSDSSDLPVEIRPERDDFAVERTNGAFSPGDSGSLTLTVTNQRNETVSNVQAKLFTDDPLDSSDDEAFVSSLEPGESATVTFDLSVGGGAMAKNYSVSMDFRYDDARGESQLSDTYRVPVTVETAESTLGPLLVGGIVVALLVLAVVAWRFGLVDQLRSRLSE
ncbi:COG1361 S-layer family protein [Halapricum hydrolyticum]|uniref:NEW3 domain-containing protein n=1 Tax=Halapricum hydrolyticum TaxID=2979991 RepID=A0AAE3IC34_9EURY|nr:NEW3 domain-containing protein [Halapricum hydrolyticum]MCU4718643.1 NEW3 domain-containing protein [Halapricum hydrolyticum]MCU4727671.1 NEW3 domain-containing protein [Halapricum hydrolyticum]